LKQEDASAPMYRRSLPLSST